MGSVSAFLAALWLRALRPVLPLFMDVLDRPERVADFFDSDEGSLILVIGASVLVVAAAVIVFLVVRKHKKQK